MKNKIYLGISGKARVGKNLFADIATNILKQKHGLTCKSWALAYYLKDDCEQFIKDKLGLSVWTEISEEKSIFRPMLVWYGDVKRKQSKARYWIDKLKEDVLKSPADVNIITDIRYAVNEKDEHYFIQNELEGKLIHLDKFHYDPYVEENTGNCKTKFYVSPANDHEKINDPIVKEYADIKVEWEDQIATGSVPYTSLLKNEYLNRVVENALIEVFIPEVKVCQRCHIQPGVDDHTCPYNEDINGDYESKCNCCADCTHECCMDI